MDAGGNEAVVQRVYHQSIERVPPHVADFDSRCCYLVGDAATRRLYTWIGVRSSIPDRNFASEAAQALQQELGHGWALPPVIRESTVLRSTAEEVSSFRRLLGMPAAAAAPSAAAGNSPIRMPPPLQLLPPVPLSRTRLSAVYFPESGGEPSLTEVAVAAAAAGTSTTAATAAAAAGRAGGCSRVATTALLPAAALVDGGCTVMVVETLCEAFVYFRRNSSAEERCAAEQWAEEQKRRAAPAITAAAVSSVTAVTAVALTVGHGGQASGPPPPFSFVTLVEEGFEPLLFRRRFTGWDSAAAVGGGNRHAVTGGHRRVPSPMAMKRPRPLSGNLGNHFGGNLGNKDFGETPRGSNSGGALGNDEEEPPLLAPQSPPPAAGAYGDRPSPLDRKCSYRRGHHSRGSNISLGGGENGWGHGGAAGGPPAATAAAAAASKAAGENTSWQPSQRRRSSSSSPPPPSSAVSGAVTPTTAASPLPEEMDPELMGLVLPSCSAVDGDVAVTNTAALSADSDTQAAVSGLHAAVAGAVTPAVTGTDELLPLSKAGLAAEVGRSMLEPSNGTAAMVVLGIADPSNLALTVAGAFKPRAALRQWRIKLGGVPRGGEPPHDCLLYDPLPAGGSAAAKLRLSVMPHGRTGVFTSGDAYLVVEHRVTIAGSGVGIGGCSLGGSSSGVEVLVDTVVYLWVGSQYPWPRRLVAVLQNDATDRLLAPAVEVTDEDIRQQVGDAVVSDIAVQTTTKVIVEEGREPPFLLGLFTSKGRGAVVLRGSCARWKSSAGKRPRTPAANALLPRPPPPLPLPATSTLLPQPSLLEGSVAATGDENALPPPPPGVAVEADDKGLPPPPPLTSTWLAAPAEVMAAAPATTRVFEVVRAPPFQWRGQHAYAAMEVPAAAAARGLHPAKTYLVMCGAATEGTAAGTFRELYVWHGDQAEPDAAMEGFVAFLVRDPSLLFLPPPPQRAASGAGGGPRAACAGTRGESSYGCGTGGPPLMRGFVQHLRPGGAIPDEFWAALGAVEPIPEVSAAEAVRPVRLWCVSHAAARAWEGTMSPLPSSNVPWPAFVAELGALCVFQRRDLAANASYVLDGGGDSVIVWHGALSPPAERATAVRVAKIYCASLAVIEDHESSSAGGCMSGGSGVAPTLLQAEQGHEPVAFTSCFRGWDTDRQHETAAALAVTPANSAVLDGISDDLAAVSSNAGGIAGVSPAVSVVAGRIGTLFHARIDPYELSPEDEEDVRAMREEAAARKRFRTSAVFNGASEPLPRGRSRSPRGGRPPRSPRGNISHTPSPPPSTPLGLQSPAQSPPQLPSQPPTAATAEPPSPPPSANSFIRRPPRPAAVSSLSPIRPVTSATVSPDYSAASPSLTPVTTFAAAVTPPRTAGGSAAGLETAKVATLRRDSGISTRGAALGLVCPLEELDLLDGGAGASSPLSISPDGHVVGAAYPLQPPTPNAQNGTAAAVAAAAAHISPVRMLRRIGSSFRSGGSGTHGTNGGAGNGGGNDPEIASSSSAAAVTAVAPTRVGAAVSMAGPWANVLTSPPHSTATHRAGGAGGNNRAVASGLGLGSRRGSGSGSAAGSSSNGVGRRPSGSGFAIGSSSGSGGAGRSGFGGGLGSDSAALTAAATGSGGTGTGIEGGVAEQSREGRSPPRGVSGLLLRRLPSVDALRRSRAPSRSGVPGSSSENSGSSGVETSNTISASATSAAAVATSTDAAAADCRGVRRRELLPADAAVAAAATATARARAAAAAAALELHAAGPPAAAASASPVRVTVVYLANGNDRAVDIEDVLYMVIVQDLSLPRPAVAAAVPAATRPRSSRSAAAAAAAASQKWSLQRSLTDLRGLYWLIHDDCQGMQHKFPGKPRRIGTTNTAGSHAGGNGAGTSLPRSGSGSGAGSSGGGGACAIVGGGGGAGSGYTFSNAVASGVGDAASRVAHHETVASINSWLRELLQERLGRMSARGRYRLFCFLGLVDALPTLQIEVGAARRREADALAAEMATGGGDVAVGGPYSSVAGFLPQRGLFMALRHELEQLAHEVCREQANFLMHISAATDATAAAEAAEAREKAVADVAKAEADQIWKKRRRLRQEMYDALQARATEPAAAAGSAGGPLQPLPVPPSPTPEEVRGQILKELDNCSGRRDPAGHLYGNINPLWEGSGTLRKESPRSQRALSEDPAAAPSAAATAASNAKAGSPTAVLGVAVDLDAAAGTSGKERRFTDPPMPEKERVRNGDPSAPKDTSVMAVADRSITADVAATPGTGARRPSVHTAAASAARTAAVAAAPVAAKEPSGLWGRLASMFGPSSGISADSNVSGSAGGGGSSAAAHLPRKGSSVPATAQATPAHGLSPGSPSAVATLHAYFSGREAATTATGGNSGYGSSYSGYKPPTLFQQICGDFSLYRAALQDLDKEFLECTGRQKEALAQAERFKQVREANESRRQQLAHANAALLLKGDQRIDDYLSHVAERERRSGDLFVL